MSPLPMACSLTTQLEGEGFEIQDGEIIPPTVDEVAAPAEAETAEAAAGDQHDMSWLEEAPEAAAAGQTQAEGVFESEGEFFEDDSPSSGAALASLDGGLVFERDASFNGFGLLQTLEPRVYYLYSEYEEQTDQHPVLYATWYDAVAFCEGVVEIGLATGHGTESAIDKGDASLLGG